MTELEKERLLAECLEAYHRRRALGETPRAEDYRERLGEQFGEFEELLAAETAIDDLLAPPEVAEFPIPFGEYTLVAQLGRGAMGVVYEAVHRSLGRKVALKVLRTGFDTEPLALERFRREARACAQIRHDSIVEIYEAGHVEGKPFYAMPMLEGRSLADLIRSGEVPAPEVLAKGLAGIADALEALNSAGIVHRDVKPGNIMVESSGRMVLADFGLARTAASHSLTQTGQALGTPLYMSPEQLLAKTSEIDGRTDVYGLGVTLYEALACQPPFKADDTSGLMRMILNDRPRPLPDLAVEIPLPICFVTMKAMERRREDRYQTAGEMRDDLLAFAEGREVKGRPVSAFRYQIRRMRRYALPAAAALILAVGLVAWSQLRPGILVIESIPVADVVIDGSAIGRTPVEVSLSPGKYEVLLKLAGFGDRMKILDIGAGDKRTIEVELVVSDPDDSDALALLGEEVGVPMGRFTAMARTRGGPPPIEMVLVPNGRARLEDLLRIRIEVDPESRADPAGKIEFRKGDLLLAELSFDPDEATTYEDFPPAVLEALGPGDELTWTVRPKVGNPVTATVEVVTDELRSRFEAIEKRLTEQPWIVRSHLKSQLLLNDGLYWAAAKEARLILDERPNSPRALAAMLRSLEELGLRNSSEWVDVQGRMDDLPAKVRDRIYGAR